jgi:hypothetical protein
MEHLLLEFSVMGHKGIKRKTAFDEVFDTGP